MKLTQSNAILRHISRVNGLDGKTGAEKDRVDLLENEVMDFRNGFVGLSYNPDYVSWTENCTEEFARRGAEWRLFIKNKEVQGAKDT